MQKSVAYLLKGLAKLLGFPLIYESSGSGNGGTSRAIIYMPVHLLTSKANVLFFKQDKETAAVLDTL